MTAARHLALALLVALPVPASAALPPERPGHPNFDLRLSEAKPDVEALAAKRAGERGPDGFTAEAALAMRDARRTIERERPGLRIVDSLETGAPEVVGATRGRRFLTGPSTAPREQIVRQFLARNAALYGLTPGQAASLELDADYTNPAGNLSWVRLSQRFHGLPVFRGEIQFALTRDGEIAGSTGQLAAGLPDGGPELRSPSLSAAQAVAAAAATIGRAFDPARLVARDAALDGTEATVDGARFDRPARTRQIWFPLGFGAAELAWSTELWTDGEAYLVLVDAEKGDLLFRKNLTEYDAFTYHVYDADSPAPDSPTSATPDNHAQASGISRTAVVVESENSMNDPWLDAFATSTAGNNTIAGIDVDGSNGVDAAAPTTSTKTFNYSYSPAPAGADAPTGAAYRGGAVTNLFFWTNRYHDRLYDLGFTEAAFNFQNDNYGRGGVGGDRVSAEAQDSSGTNNANFTTPADGGSGRMQMFVWTGPTPDRDGDLDAEIILHELTHGTSNRLHGNTSGLSTNMSRGMGEGWSDFYALSILSDPSDDPDGIYAMGGYSTYLLDPTFTDNYYYGIRRFPRAPITNLGANGKPHNPQTFADIDSTQKDLSDGAFPLLVKSWISTTADQVHAAGEVWSSALWEARFHVIDSLGNAAGNERMLQLVTDGMKLDPASPTFLQARDSILAADCAGYGGASEIDLWTGFAARGMGYGAEVLATSPARVIESFDGANLAFGTIAVTNRTCDEVDREPIPGDVLELAVELVNPYCATAVGSVSGSIPGGSSADWGTLPAGDSASRTLLYTVPGATACNSQVGIDIDVTSSLGATGTSLVQQVGPSAITVTEFSNTTPITIPAGAPGTTSGPATPYPSNVLVSGIVKPVIGVRLTFHDYEHTWPDDVDVLLVGPTGAKMVVMSDAFGTGTDGLLIDLTLDDAAASPLPDSGGFVAGTYQPTNFGSGDLFDAPAPAGPYLDPPLSGFAGLDPNGTWSLYIDDDTGADDGSIAGGWTIGILTAADVVCAPCATPGIFSDDFETGDTSRWYDRKP